MCKEYGVCFPHELMGYERNSTPGILQTLELMEATAVKQERLAKSNKGKQQSRRSRMYSKNPNYRRH